MREGTANGRLTSAQRVCSGVNDGARVPHVQAHEQLMAEVAWASSVTQWHSQRLQRRVLRGWRRAAAAASQDRQAAAQHEHTWQRVRGWLSELHEQRSPAQVYGAVQYAAGAGAGSESPPPLAAAAAVGGLGVRDSWDALLAALADDLSAAGADGGDAPAVAAAEGCGGAACD